MKLALMFVLAAGCGGGLSAKQSQLLGDAMQENLAADRLLDAGAARALERGAYCDTANAVFLGGGAVPDSGIQCPNPQ